MKKLMIFAAILALAALSLSADIYVKSKSHTDAMSIMGQNTPAKDDVSEQWISDYALAQSSAAQGFIIDLKKNTMTFLNHGKKTYVETTLPLDMAKILPPQMAAMAGMMTMTATVTPGQDKKKIGNWNCSLYDMNMSVMGMAMPMKIWASTDVPFDTAKYASLFANLLKGQMRLDDASVKEFQKIRGFQIASEMNAEIMGAKMHTSSEVLEIAVKPAPANAYSVPKGYVKKDTLAVDEIQKH
jgi:hypothetical protein